MLTYTAFEEFKIVSQGTLDDVAISVKHRLKEQGSSNILIFSDSTGRQIDLDLSGTDKQVLDRLKVFTTSSVQTQSGAGRPKLGVLPREISLLPSHWEWLLNQEGGSSAVIRNLIDEKMKTQLIHKNKIAQERTYKFLSAHAGNLPSFEDAVRFLYRKDKKKFMDQISGWPKDVLKYTLSLSSDAF